MKILLSGLSALSMDSSGLRLEPHGRNGEKWQASDCLEQSRKLSWRAGQQESIYQRQVSFRYFTVLFRNVYPDVKRHIFPALALSSVDELDCVEVQSKRIKKCRVYRTLFTRMLSGLQISCNCIALHHTTTSGSFSAVSAPIFARYLVNI